MVRCGIRFLLMLACLSPAGALAVSAACVGDCDGDGFVTVNEIVQGVAIALGQAPVTGCPNFDRDGKGAVSIADLLAGVNALLTGCQGTPVATATPPPTALPTPTATLNRPPARPSPLVYRTYPEREVALPLVVDLEGDPVSCQADSLPSGMTVDGAGVLHWTPLGSQLGPLSLPFTCTDDADPPGTAMFTQHFRVAALDGCAMPDCAPERGCTAALPPVDEPCCTGATIQRTGEPVAGCPEGRVLQIGRNEVGFGRLQNCDRLHFSQVNQAGAEIRFHIRFRCLNPLNRVKVSAHMETEEKGIIVNAEQQVFPTPRPEFIERRSIRVPIGVPGPFFPLEGAEANLTVTVTDIPNGAMASETIRVILTSDDVPDLSDP